MALADFKTAYHKQQDELILGTGSPILKLGPGTAQLIRARPRGCMRVRAQKEGLRGVI